MQWTSAKPNVPSWYWYRESRRDEPSIIVFDLEESVFVVMWETLEPLPLERYAGASGRGRWGCHASEGFNPASQFTTIFALWRWSI